MQYIKIHSLDNVAVALADLAEGTEVTFDNQSVTLRQAIGRGHKFALIPIAKGENVVKYGLPIGHALADIAPGEYIHSHNTRTNLSDLDEYSYQPDFQPEEGQAADREVQIYRRASGEVGIRNELWILPTVGCVNGIARQIQTRFLKETNDAEGTDGVYLFSHTYGCSQLGDDHINTRTMLQNMVRHPNAGAVLVILDVTEKEQRERLRREFTANVSHELKTPLQSIIGSAELLENGLVKPEDQPRFLNRIHQEADRLVALINDILRLSQLDEGGALPHEQVSVLELAQEAARSLTAQAAAQAVHISVTGIAGTVFGVRRLLYEIARNLCENAVKYNVPGGSVTVEVAETDRDVTLLVRDTGIGIPEGDQSRVFERFYRVDKSHSRAIGGTGLGLSIVKHAVAYHHGTLRLESQPGKGTVITVTLPKEPTE